MIRHAKVTNREIHKTFCVPYSGTKVDHSGKGFTVEERVRMWCQEKKIPGPLTMIETTSKRDLNVRLY